MAPNVHFWVTRVHLGGQRGQLPPPPPLKVGGVRRTKFKRDYLPVHT